MQENQGTNNPLDIAKEVKAYENYLRLSNFQPSTIKAYVRTVRIFLTHSQKVGIKGLPSQTEVQSYLLMRVDKGKSWSTINADYSALRKYYKVLQDYDWSLKKMPRPRREKTMPAILSREEVLHLINSAPNLKYQVFLTLLYSTGMRLSEACNLKLTDIDSDRMQIRISKGKGAKDRMVHMPERLLDILRSYYRCIKPQTYLFNGKVKGSKYSTSAGQWSIRRARLLGNITKKCSIHTLRNCYATHHLELGTDLVYLQEQLGHKNLKTTAKYIRLCIERYRQINHPIDRIKPDYRLPM